MATVTGIKATSGMLFVNVTTGSEARPTGAGRVLWIGGTTRPTNMGSSDLWLKEVTEGAEAPDFVTLSLGTMTQGVAFSQSLNMNGTTPITFGLAGGTFPAGITINSTTGVISGTPTTAATYSFSIVATNAVGSSTRTYTGQVTATAVAPTIITTTINSLTQGSPFTQTLSVTGTSPISWTVSGGVLPAGLSLNSSNGTISGTPTGTGAYSFSITATNSVSANTKGFTGTIGSSGVAPTITTTTLTSLQAGVGFSQALACTGSTPLTWGVSAGTIPAGLSINTTTGTISGTPTTAGSYSFTAQATNAYGNDTQLYTGTIAAASSADVYSIFGSTTWPLTSYTDGISGAWNVHQYYQLSSEAAMSGAKIIGARLYVPPGSAHIGLAWKAACVLNSSGTYIGGSNTIDTVAAFNAATAYNGSALVAGWNEVTFTTELTPPSGSGNSWMIGVMIGSGTTYLYDSTYTALAVRNPGGKNFFLSEIGTSPVARSLYLSGTTIARWYGIDVLIRVPA